MTLNIRFFTINISFEVLIMNVREHRVVLDALRKDRATARLADFFNFDNATAAAIASSHRSLEFGAPSADIRAADTGDLHPRVLHGFQSHGEERGDEHQGAAGVRKSGRRAQSARYG